MIGGDARRLIRRVVPLSLRRPVGIALYRARLSASRAPDEILGRLPFLAARDLVYRDGFFAQIESEATALYECLAATLTRLRGPASVVDVGCGSGIMLAWFAEHGVSVRGIEGSRAAIRRSPVGDRIVRANLERGVPDLGRYDLCLCTEVAEHLSARSAPRLVEGLTRLSDLVVFTAAPPGQGGIAHVNMRPKSYWRGLFARNGFDESPIERELLNSIAVIPQPGHIHDNLMVFEKKRQSASDQARV